MRQQRKLNEEVNDDLAVKREEGFICCSRIVACKDRAKLEIGPKIANFETLSE